MGGLRQAGPAPWSSTGVEAGKPGDHYPLLSKCPHCDSTQWIDDKHKKYCPKCDKRKPVGQWVATYYHENLANQVLDIIEGFGSRKNIGLPQGKLKRVEKKVEIEGIHYHARPVIYAGNIAGHKVKIKGSGIEKEVFNNSISPDDAITKVHALVKKGVYK